jgi:streptogramin lyase
MRRFCIVAVALIAAGCSSHSSLPTPGSINPQIFQHKVSGNGWEFTVLKLIDGQIPQPFGLVADANHKVWVTASDGNGHSMLTKIAMDQKLTTYQTTVGGGPIALGSDGNFWIVGRGAISRVTPTGQETDFPINGFNGASAITLGSDGALWFPECTDATHGGIGRMDTSGNYSFTLIDCLHSIVSGPDGNIWSSDGGFAYTVNTQGQLIAQYTIGDTAMVQSMAVGSDHSIYGESMNSNGPDLFKITTLGAVVHLGKDSFDDGMQSMASGPDGNLWITAGSHLLTYDVSNEVYARRIKGPSTGNIVLGPDANLWTTDSTTGRIDTFIWAAMVIAPQKFTLPNGQNSTITVSENNYTGTWTAVAKNPLIVSVTPNSQTGTFTVTGLAPGTTFVTVYDSMFNSIQSKVTVQ